MHVQFIKHAPEEENACALGKTQTHKTYKQIPKHLYDLPGSVKVARSLLKVMVKMIKTDESTEKI